MTLSRKASAALWRTPWRRHLHRAPLSSLLDTVSVDAATTGKLTAHIGQEWLQGQTTYGGLTAALCLHGGRNVLGDDALPVRSAHVTFMGPAGANITIDSTIMKRGKSMAFVQSELIGAKGVATSTCLVFGKARGSSIDRSFAAPPPAGLPPPAASPLLFEALGFNPPIFTHNFEARLAKGGSMDGIGTDASNWLWVRHVGADDEGGIDGVAPDVALLALADMPPPALLPLLPRGSQFPNVSSITWMVNWLDDHPAAAPGGWWLLESRAESARVGYSSQDMSVWGGDVARGPALVGRQLVAVYV